jgi:hypothetical protein
VKDGEMDRNNKIISFQLKRGCHFGWNLKKAGIRKLHPSSKFQPFGWNLEEARRRMESLLIFVDVN